MAEKVIEVAFLPVLMLKSLERTQRKLSTMGCGCTAAPECPQELVLRHLCLLCHCSAASRAWKWFTGVFPTKLQTAVDTIACTLGVVFQKQGAIHLYRDSSSWPFLLSISLIFTSKGISRLYLCVKHQRFSFCSKAFPLNPVPTLSLVH